jgi:hypothetical protein
MAFEQRVGSPELGEDLVLGHAPFPRGPTAALIGRESGGFKASQEP